jgi:hypothetical protein
MKVTLIGIQQNTRVIFVISSLNDAFISTFHLSTFLTITIFKKLAFNS